MKVSVVIRQSYSDGVEAIPFRTSEAARAWIKVDMDCAVNKLRKEGYTPIRTTGKVTCTEQEDDIYYLYWEDDDVDVIGEPSKEEEPKSIHIVVTSCYLENDGGVCAFPFYREVEASPYMETRLKDAEQKLLEMGFTPIKQGDHVQAKEDHSFYFDAYLFPTEEFMDS